MPTKYNFTSRGLSDYESVLDLSHQNGDGVFCHVMILKSRVEISLDVIKNAFKWLVHYQPALRMCVQTQMCTNGLVKRFVERPDPKAVDVEHLVSSRDGWGEVIENECSRPFVSAHGALWKVIFMEVPVKVQVDMDNRETIRTYALVFKVSHVIADHWSIHNMLSRQLMQLLEPSLDISRLKHFRTPLYMKPSVDQSLSTRKPTRAKKSAKQPRCTPTKANEPTYLGLSQEFSFVTETSVEEEAHTRVFVNALTKTDMTSLLRLCRKNNVPAHDVFTVAAVHAFFLAMRAQRTTLTSSGIRVCHWLDLRNFHGVSRKEDPLGMWLCPIFTKHKMPKGPPTPSRFWSQVKKLALSLKYSEEPWRQTFREYEDILKGANAVALSDRDDAFSPEIVTPKAHVAVSFLDARRVPESTRSKKGSWSKGLSTAVKRKSTVTSRLSSASNTDVIVSPPQPPGSLRPLTIAEYHVAGSASPQSASSLNLAVVLNDSSASCTLATNGSKVPRTFAQSFLGLFAKVVGNMVSRTNRHSSVVDKLPPYVRARIMTKTPGDSKI